MDREKVSVSLCVQAHVLCIGCREILCHAPFHFLVPCQAASEPQWAHPSETDCTLITLRRSWGPGPGEEWRVEYSTAEWRVFYSPWINTTLLHLWSATRHLRWQREGELMWCVPFLQPSNPSVAGCLQTLSLMKGHSATAGHVLWEPFPSVTTYTQKVVIKLILYKDTTHNLWLT